MHQHLKIVAWLQIGNAGMLIAIALFSGTLLTAIGAASGDPEALGVMAAISGFIALVCGILALPSLLAGWGLLTYKPWARVLTIILSVLNLPGFPIGTLIGGYSLWVLLNDEAQQILRARGGQRYSY
jgi:hypothetical protein